MPKRNGHNPIRSQKGGKQSLGQYGNDTIGQNKVAGTVQCPKCHEAVPPKPGFRISSLKCPKCGSALGK